MKIKTYYTHCPNHAGWKEPALLELWHTYWLKLGWKTQTMTKPDAELHPYFSFFDSIVSHLPTVNSKEYEVACFHRWLALAQTGGGFMSDYDVFPNKNFSNQDLDESKLDPTKLHIFQMRGVCPSLVWCTSEVALKTCELFTTAKYGLRTINNRQHYSDMYALADMNNSEDFITVHDLVRNYLDGDGWVNEKVIHFNNSSMRSNGKIPKFEYIPKILESL